MNKHSIARLCITCFYRQQEEYLRRTLDYSEDSTQPASANSSVCEGPTSPLIVDNTLNSMEADAKHSQEVESLKRLLQEVRINQRRTHWQNKRDTLLMKSKINKTPFIDEIQHNQCAIVCFVSFRSFCENNWRLIETVCLLFVCLFVWHDCS